MLEFAMADGCDEVLVFIFVEWATVKLLVHHRFAMLNVTVRNPRANCHILLRRDSHRRAKTPVLMDVSPASIYADQTRDNFALFVSSFRSVRTLVLHVDSSAITSFFAVALAPEQIFRSTDKRAPPNSHLISWLDVIRVHKKSNTLRVADMKRMDFLRCDGDVHEASHQRLRESDHGVVVLVVQTIWLRISPSTWQVHL